MWLTADDSRVGLGCMRLTADSRATVHAALEAGVTIFDTAFAYPDNERWLGRALSEHPLGAKARVVTKGGLIRVGTQWVPDGRAKALRAHCEASLEALGRPIDLYLLHTVDPRVDFATSLRALEALRVEGLVRAIGVSNVTRAQLDEAMQHANLVAVQQGVSLFDDRAMKSGVLTRALELGLTVQCHTPLGGPKRAAKLSSREAIDALAQLLALNEQVMVLPGARRPETIRAAVEATRVTASPAFHVVKSDAREDPGVVLLMGVQGAGKTSHVPAHLKRLNRDTRGGTLASLHAHLDDALTRGERGFVLDNTYVTRAQRFDVIQVAAKHGQAIHGRWFDIDSTQAQVNIVTRMLDVHGRLLEPAELLRGKTPDSLGPGSFFRTLRTVEAPTPDEGFTTLEHVPFKRRPWSEGKPALFVGLDQLEAGVPTDDAHVIVLGWREGGLQIPNVTTAICPHPAGPPTCWCRPPLPGLVLAAARTHGIDLSKSRLVTTSPALRSLGAALGFSIIS